MARKREDIASFVAKGGLVDQILKNRSKTKEVDYWVKVRFKDGESEGNKVRDVGGRR